jgi:hypothetical protein
VSTVAAPPGSEEELLDGIVFRLAKVSDQFPRTARKLLTIHVRLTNADIAEAQRLGKPAMLSVWDRDRVTAEEVRALMSDQVSEYIPFRWLVPQVRQIQISSTGASLRVLRDPRVAILIGAAHCGIAGFGPECCTKLDQKNVTSQLADIAERF